ncbi:High_cysteine membrane protein Group 4 [Hexamita inflata]|uniref:High_cysteine membrane protein Group 4 n=1 Tax=Hexamita inflata TaxID=28002 RepID=A0ABP1J5Z2_9EUKA
MLFHVSLQIADLYFCDWMFTSRIWSPRCNCELNSRLNLNSWSNSAQQISSSLDLQVVTVSSFVSSTYERVTLFKALDLGTNGLLENAHVLTNVSVLLDQASDSVQIVPFGSVMGKLDNVTVSGFVNISSINNRVKNVKLSRILGDIGLMNSINYPSQYTGEFSFRNISSSLRFFVNGVEITENTEVNGVTYTLENAFDQDVNVTVNNYDVQNDQNMHHFTYELTDSVEKITQKITAWFPFALKFNGNDYSNALNDLYPYPLQMSLEKYYETKGMTLRRFNADGIELEFPFYKTQFVIYQENTKAVAIFNQQLLICSGTQIFDIISKTCITRDECLAKSGQFLFQSTCVIQCPYNFFVFNKTCYKYCPQYQGAYQQGQICIQAPENYFATQFEAVTTCSDYIFRKGCYKVCPTGTIINGINCIEPTTISQCTDEYLVLTGQIDNIRFYNQCSKTAPVWMYQLLDQQNKVLNIYKGTCEGIISLNNECQDITPYEKNNGLCQQLCTNGEYQQVNTQSCSECLSTLYDGGLILEPSNNKCVSTCSKYTIEGTKKICQDKTPENCPFWQVVSTGQYQCQNECSNIQFTDGTVCSSCNPTLNQVADKINGGCICLANYFIKKLQDESILCTECDTSLHFQDSKVAGVCVCIDGQTQQDDRCVSYCPSTQIFLAGASGCSDCELNQIPNLNQDACVSKTACSPGYLNLEGTFCIESCFVFSAYYNQQNQCVTCGVLDALSQFSVNQCICVQGASKASQSSVCFCNTGFITQSNSCTCSKKLSSNLMSCSDKCPETEVSINGNAQCSVCIGKVPNAGQTACVELTACTPDFLNLAKTKCIYDCASDKAGVGINNQCDQCQNINQLSTFQTSSCGCTPNAIGSGTNCICNVANGFQLSDCSCLNKLSSNGQICAEKCPNTEIFLLGATQCSKCPPNQIPNLNQDACVSKTACSPGYLNLEGTFCIESCFVFSAYYNQQNQCVTCGVLDALSQFSVNQCICVQGASKASQSSVCFCNTGFITQSNSCTCSKKLSSNLMSCSDKCPETEVSINGNAQCSVCIGKVPNAGQTACVELTACTPDFLNLAKTKCIYDCASDKAGVGINNQCDQCQNINQLSTFQTSSCGCTPNAIGSGTNCICNVANGFQLSDCSCLNKLSSNGQICAEKCPNTEIFLLGATQCSKCPPNQIPNLNQDACENALCTNIQFQYNGKCYDQCPQTTTKTRNQTCIKDCTIFDQYPNQNYCEIAGNPNCLNIRLVQQNIYICTICTSIEFHNDFECKQNCDGQFVLYSNKQICTSSCGQKPKGYIQETFNQVSVNVCYDKCPPELPDYDTQTILGTQKCFISTCDLQNKYLEINLRCVSICASGMYIVNSSSTMKFQCVPTNYSCNKYYKNDEMKECYNTCPLVYPFLNYNECLSSCPIYMNDPKSSTQKICLDQCGGVNPPYINIDSNKRTQCTYNCGSMFVQQSGKQLSCVSFCQFYTWDGISKICANQCNYYRIDISKDQIAKWCGESCFQLNLTYSYVDINDLNHCIQQCPSQQPFLDGTICTNNCQYIVQQIITEISKYKCQKTPCQQYSISYPQNNNVKICVLNCVGETPYTFGLQCVKNCMSTENQLVDIDNQTCVKYCVGESANNNNKYCNKTCDFFIENDTKYCQTVGTSVRPYKQLYQQIQINQVITLRYQFVQKCLNNEYQLQNNVPVCQSCVYYESVGESHKCVPSCQNSQVQLGYQCFTGLCKDIGDKNSNIYTGIDNQCSQSCGMFFVYDQSLKCSTTCPQNSAYFVDQGSLFCTLLCTGTDDYITLETRYVVNGVGKCVKKCPIGQFKELLQVGNIYKQCVNICQNKQYKIENDEQFCVDYCPAYSIEPLQIKRCYESCEQSNNNKISLVISATETLCVQNCPLSHPFMPQNNEQICVETCPSKLYVLIDGIRKCVDQCASNTSIELNFKVNEHYQCVGACDETQLYQKVLSNLESCVQVCPKQFNYYDIKRECQEECDPKFYRIDGQQKQCMTSCYSPYTYITVIDDYTQCNQVCEPPTPYSLLNNVCTKLCPPGTFLHDFVCKLSCPKYMKYALYDNGQFICSELCPTKIYSKLSDDQVFYCQNSCDEPNLYRKDIKTGQMECLLECELTEYKYSTGECSQFSCLRDPVYKFSLGMICVSTCPDFVDFETYECLSKCEGSFSGYVEQILLGETVRVCHLNCPTKYIDMRLSSLYKQVGQCSTYCAQNEQLYIEAFSDTQFYCTLCASNNQFIQLDLVNCKSTCLSGFFITSSNLNYCASSCDMPMGISFVYGLSKCQVCPHYVSELDQACLEQCDYYNVSQGTQVCRMKDNLRNPDSCPSYTNNNAPFLCVAACLAMRDGPWCVNDCSVTGKRFVPDSGFDCVLSCPYYYEYQIVFNVEQPRCISTCDFMRSTSDTQECQQTCNTITVYVFGLTFCSNCTQVLIITDSGFSCSNSCSQQYQTNSVCSYIPCDQISVQVNQMQMNQKMGENPTDSSLYPINDQNEVNQINTTENQTDNNQLNNKSSQNKANMSESQINTQNNQKQTNNQKQMNQFDNQTNNLQSNDKNQTNNPNQNQNQFDNKKQSNMKNKMNQTNNQLNIPNQFNNNQTVNQNQTNDQNNNQFNKLNNLLNQLNKQSEYQNNNQQNSNNQNNKLLNKQIEMKTINGFICAAPFSFNISTTSSKQTNQIANVHQIRIQQSSIFVLLQNGTVQRSGITFAHNVKQIQSISTPPIFQEKLFILFQNDSVNFKILKENVKRIISFQDEENAINFMLTNDGIYFRGSCAEMCGKNENGEYFDTKFNGKTKFRGMWTKTNILPIKIEDIIDIKEMDWAVLFTLQNGEKYVYGKNNYGRLCTNSNLKTAVLNVSDYDQIYVGNTTTLLSQGEKLYYCGAAFGIDQPDTNELHISPTKLEIEYSGYLGWSFTDNTIIKIQGVNNGFIIQTNTQIFGIGQCLAFDCFNFQGQQIFYSNIVQKLKWLSQELIVLGNKEINIQYYKQALNITYFNDTKVDEIETQTQNGTIDYINFQSKAQSKTKLKVAIGITSVLYVISITVITQLIKKMKKQSQNAVFKSIRKPKDTTSQIVKMKFQQQQESIFDNVEKEDYNYVM